MKKIYVKPETELIAAETLSIICASNKIKVRPNAHWGEMESQNQYSNDAWINEGYEGKSIGYSQGLVVPVAGDDTDDLFSRSNSSLWED